MFINIPYDIIHQVNNTIYRFLHFEKVYDKNYVVPFKNNLLLPTVERAIIDYIRYESIRDEGTLIWALQDYINDERYNMDKIYEVADFYNVSRRYIYGSNKSNHTRDRITSE